MSARVLPSMTTWNCRGCGFGGTPMSRHECGACGRAWGGGPDLRSLLSNDGCAAVQNNVLQINVSSGEPSYSALLEAADEAEQDRVRELEEENEELRSRQAWRPSPWQRFALFTMTLVGWIGIMVFVCAILFFVALILKLVAG